MVLEELTYRFSPYEQCRLFAIDNALNFLGRRFNQEAIGGLTSNLSMLEFLRRENLSFYAYFSPIYFLNFKHWNNIRFKNNIASRKKIIKKKKELIRLKQNYCVLYHCTPWTLYNIYTLEKWTHWVFASSKDGNAVKIIDPLYYKLKYEGLGDMRITSDSNLAEKCKIQILIWDEKD